MVTCAAEFTVEIPLKPKKGRAKTTAMSSRSDIDSSSDLATVTSGKNT